MKNIILLFLILAFTSCATFKKNSLNENRISLSENDLKKFEGTFKIVSKDSSERNLDASLLKYYSFRILSLKKRVFEEYDCKINLSFLDKNHLRVELINDTTIIELRVLKFKVKESYIVLKKTNEFRFFILMNGIHTINTRIALLENENLTIDSISSYLGFLLILPLGDHKREYYGLEFERIE
ncbi:hypothetical protein WAF17_11125 [Bernardetia sp. ABR2-2B]|uniref:hypothetical protein n=1 Tax=Bernardetia sp. ABR2-2B TaxID=3127472 RepID=UPI0030CB30FA